MLLFYNSLNSGKFAWIQLGNGRFASAEFYHTSPSGWGPAGGLRSVPDGPELARGGSRQYHAALNCPRGIPVMKFVPALTALLTLVVAIAPAFGQQAPEPPNPTAVIHTSMGDITVELFAREAPVTVENFISYARSGFYAGTLFHRWRARTIRTRPRPSSSSTCRTTRT
jgi:hypothetical protein